MRILARASPFVLIEANKGNHYLIWLCPNLHAIVEVYLDHEREELVSEPCPQCGLEALASDFSTALRQLLAQLDHPSIGSIQEGGVNNKIIEAPSTPVLLPAPVDYQPLTVNEENDMQHIINGQATQCADSHEAEPVTQATDLTQSLWRTVKTRTFVVGMALGGLVTYLSLQLAQHLMQQDGSDEPF